MFTCLHISMILKFEISLIFNQFMIYDGSDVGNKLKNIIS